MTDDFSVQDHVLEERPAPATAEPPTALRPRKAEPTLGEALRNLGTPENRAAAAFVPNDPAADEAPIEAAWIASKVRQTIVETAEQREAARSAWLASRVGEAPAVRQALTAIDQFRTSLAPQPPDGTTVQPAAAAAVVIEGRAYPSPPRTDTAPVAEAPKVPNASPAAPAQATSVPTDSSGPAMPVAGTGGGGSAQGGTGGTGGGGSGGTPLQRRSGDREFRDVLGKGLSRCRRKFVMVGLFSFWVNTLVLGVPIYLFNISDRVLTSRSLDTLIMLTLVIVGAIVGHVVLDIVRRFILMRIAVEVEFRLGAPVLAAAAKASQAGSSRDFQTLADLQQIRNFITGPVLLTMFDAPVAPVYLLAVFLIHPDLGWIVTITGGMLLVFALINQKLTAVPFAHASAFATRANLQADAMARNAQVINAMGMIPEAVVIWGRETAESLKAQVTAQDRNIVIAGLSKGTRLITQITMLGWGASLALDGKLTGGMMIAASIVGGRALAPIEGVIDGWRSFVTARLAYARVKNLLVNSPLNMERLQLPRPLGRLTVERILYVPPPNKKVILNGLSFQLEPGESLAIVGASGTGKSTLGKMLVGSIAPTAGSVRLDSMDLRNWDPRQFGLSVGYLPQDVQLFPATIKANIARMQDTANDSDVFDAAEMADVHELISGFSQGYETMVGMDGSPLSGGQRQRIGLARAFYGDPRLVVLDEPNSNLDTPGEVALARALSRAKSKGTTVVAITQRPTLLKSVDKIMILKDGAIQALGLRDDIIPMIVGRSPAPGQRSAPRPRPEWRPAMSMTLSTDWHASVPHDTRKHSAFGIVFLFALVAGFGYWSSSAPIAGAVVASGAFVANGDNKTIQHLEGGVIRDILVKEGDVVQPGQVLIRLDDITATAELRRLDLRQNRLAAVEARLEAEMAEAPAFVPPDTLMSQQSDPDIASILKIQQQTFSARKKNLESDLAVLQDGIDALQQKIDGTLQQRASIQTQLKLVNEELDGKAWLLNQGEIRKTEVLALQRAKASAEGELGRIDGDIGDAKERIARTREQMLGARNSAIKQAAEQLNDMHAEQNDVRERIRSARNTLNRIEITAPVKGIVVQLRYHTAGGVIEPGKGIMEIVPVTDDLVIEARVRPQDIVSLKVGEPASVRLTALSQRVTPMAVGSVIYVSADAVPDDKRGQYTPTDQYVVRVRLNPVDDGPLKQFAPRPGMPAEIYIKTAERTFLQYLTKPIRDSMQRAFRES